MSAVTDETQRIKNLIGASGILGGAASVAAQQLFLAIDRGYDVTAAAAAFPTGNWANALRQAVLSGATLT